jgi:flagellar motor protein MotB
MSSYQFFNENSVSQRLSQAAKNRNSKQWYKDEIDRLDSKSFSNSSFQSFDGMTEFRRKKVNYDLYNNILNLKDFEYICKPYGAGVGNLPANMTNRDIVSSKIKVLQGMEMKMPFSWKVVAVNEEATTRREQQEFSMIRQYVANSIIQPIKQELEVQAMQMMEGKEPSEEEVQQIQQQIAQELEARTPEEVKRYMARDHQDPAEALAHQMLEYLIRKENIKDKFNKAWKHALLAGEEIYWIGILNGQPRIKVINPLYFDHDRSPDLDYIEDGEWAVCEFRMTPTEIMSNFGSELTNAEIDKIYNYFEGNLGGSPMADATFTFMEGDEYEPYSIRVIHATWKSLRKIGYLTYLDDSGQEQLTLVDENYKLNRELGDIGIEWEWIPEVHEGYKIGSDIYVNLGPVPGQHKDITNLWECKLPYYGTAYDNLNSQPTSLMDRMKSYQYFYNIIFYRLELLIASDEGKKVVMNMNAIPKSLGIDINKMLYFMKTSNIMFVNPAEEGNRTGGDVTNLVKEIDLSIAAKLNEYIQLLEYLNNQCGNSVGINKQLEGSIGASEAVTNTRQNIVQASHIVQPYFELHNIVKGNVLQALLEVAKVAYSQNPEMKIPYVLDDMSYQLLDINHDLLDNSTYGIFVGNSSKAYDAKELVQNLAQAALQNQRADLSDVIKVVRSESIQEAEELLEVSEQRKNQEAQQMEQMRGEQAKELEQMREMALEKAHEREKELIVLKEEERRKTEIQKQAMFSMGYDENKDRDEDGVPDVLEVAKHGLNADIQNRKLSLEENKFHHQKEIDKEKVQIEKKKLAQKPKGNK